MSGIPSYNMKFCPYCGEELGSKQVENKERHYCSDCDRVIWQNSKPAIAIGVKNEDKLLMIKRDIAPDKGMFSLPAGFIDRGERPEVSAVRELEEETRVKLNPDEIELFDTILIHRKDQQYTLVLVYKKELDRDLEPEKGSDADAVELWDRERFEQKKEHVREPYRKTVDRLLS